MDRSIALDKTSDDIKNMLKNLHKIGNDAEDCVYLLQTSFIYNSSRHLHECRTKAVNIRKIERTATDKLKRLSADNSSLESYLTVPLHFSKIGRNIEKLAELIDSKIRDGILFSDMAIEEITFLLQRLIDILGPTSDIILARNEILSRYIRESGEDVVKRALEYAALHEERLIEGIRSTAAAAIFLNMLDEIKSISWHARQIAIKLMR